MTVTPTSLTAYIQGINTTYNAAPASVGCVPVLTGANYVCDIPNGNSFANTGREFIYIVNGATAIFTVTVNDQNKCDHGFDHDVIATVAISGSKMLGPFPVGWFGTPCLISYNANAGTPHIAVFRLPISSPIPE